MTLIFLRQILLISYICNFFVNIYMIHSNFMNSNWEKYVILFNKSKLKRQKQHLFLCKVSITDFHVWHVKCFGSLHTFYVWKRLKEVKRSSWLEDLSVFLLNSITLILKKKKKHFYWHGGINCELLHLCSTYLEVCSQGNPQSNMEMWFRIAKFVHNYKKQS